MTQLSDTVRAEERVFRDVGKARTVLAKSDLERVFDSFTRRLNHVIDWLECFFSEKGNLQCTIFCEFKRNTPQSRGEPTAG